VEGAGTGWLSGGSTGEEGSAEEGIAGVAHPCLESFMEAVSLGLVLDLAREVAPLQRILCPCVPLSTAIFASSSRVGHRSLLLTS
jgi:hypothetical protein